MNRVAELFGCMVFNDHVMRERLPKETYKALRSTVAYGEPLDISVANVVANAMKDWALGKGATHYCHWFQPLSNVTAEKHDSFISPTRDGKIIMEFSGKELIKGELDASSFPSGGLRATFEARGYTAWDPTSYAYIKDGTLVIPTAFCSYSGEALDKKTPLLRSMEEINTQSLRILALFGGNDVVRVFSNSGLEQEYFLIDVDLYKKRPDLRFTGRTLFGAPPPKAQGSGGHYAASIKPRVLAFMQEVDEELWKLGILSKTRHNESAPSQHELAPVFTSTNIATDHNQLTMRVMKNVASRHRLACLFHEKPFAGVNGSGKHNNWSLSTDTGVNLLTPGVTPQHNAQFLLFLCAVLKGVDVYQDMIRLSSANAGNDCRLGGHEAPSPIVSVFLGDELTGILECIENQTAYVQHDALQFETGLKILPKFPKDITDRNRTSPLAFTGNKFELRMLGSSFSGSESSMTLNTIVADVLAEFADILEKDFDQLDSLLRDTIHNHKRIIFNGNGYTEEWADAAKARGLLQLTSTVEAIPYYMAEKNVALFQRRGIFSAHEIAARSEIVTANYNSAIRVEALTMLDMLRQNILPATTEYTTQLANCLKLKHEVGISTDVVEKKILLQIDSLQNVLYELEEQLMTQLKQAEAMETLYEKARRFQGVVLPILDELRGHIDELESWMSRDYWPFPTYSDLLFSM